MADRAPIGIDDLRIGTIVYFYDPESYDPKPKFCVIIGISEDLYHIATLYINSEVNINAINSPALVALQYKIKLKDYRQFLTNDSYVDCSTMKHRMKGSFLENLNAKGRIKGSLIPTDLKNVISLINNSETFSSYYLDLYKIGK
jgi:hypothetical protein